MRMRKIMQRLVIVLVLALTLISPLETVSSAASETVRAAEAGGENHTDPVISDVKDSACENTDTAMPDNENPGAGAVGLQLNREPIRAFYISRTR